MIMILNPNLAKAEKQLYLTIQSIINIVLNIVTGVGSIIFNWLSCTNEYHKLRKRNKR
jgi:hypothetical protein